MDVPLLPLLEDDTDEPGIISPDAVVGTTGYGVVPGGHDGQVGGAVPRPVVLCFFAEVVAGLLARPGARVEAVLSDAHGTHEVVGLDHRGTRVAVLHPGVGAPVAGAFLEEAIALGGRTFVAVGGAGALVPELDLGHAVVVGSAVRDEGLSHHYLPPGRTVDADPRGVAALSAAATAAGLPHRVGRTWTTDAIYRETRSRMDRRVAEGCEVVEMEAASFLAVAAFRGVGLAHLLYAGDTLAGEGWDHRDWTRAVGVREALLEVALDAVVAYDGSLHGTSGDAG